MATVILKAAIPEELYRRFYKAATNKKGKWRGGKQSAGKALEAAVQAALLSFLDSLDKPAATDSTTE
jgi:hypothetical protein